jgi:hypothetical protein
MPGFTFDLTIVLVIGLVGAMLFLPPFVASRIEAGRRAKVDWSKAQYRAEMLLEELLTASEYQQLNQRRYLEVVSPSNPERAYRLPRGPGRVAVFERGVHIENLCVQPVDQVPEGDVILTHKLMIEGSEQEYLRLAVHFEPRPRVPMRRDSVVSWSVWHD